MYTIIVADDEEELRKALIRRINWEEAGFRLIGEAENGVEALELVEKLEPDLLLTDVRMPFMSGIELARAVREIRPTMQIAFLSGFDDFSYAQQAIQYNIVSYMLKPISSGELMEELKKIKLKIDQKFKEFTKMSIESEKQSVVSFLMPLLLDSFQENVTEERNEELLDEACARGLIEDKKAYLCYSVIVTSFYDKAGKNVTTESSMNAVDSILKKYLKYASFYSDGRIVSLLVATKAGLNKYLHIIVEDIIQSVKRIMDLAAAIGVSRIVPKLINGHEAYIEAMNAMDYSRMSTTGVHFIADIERVGNFDQEMVQVTINELESLMRGGTRQELEKYLRELFLRIQNNQLAPSTIQPLIIQLVAAIFRIVYAVTDGEAVHNLQLLSPLQGQIVYDKANNTLEKYIEFCLTAKEIVAEQRKKSSSQICDRAIEMIETNYMDSELSLVSISEEISVSPNYLSALIKKSTGNTFIELLTNKRIGIAKELIWGTNMKIKEIAEICGYNDQHYFSYCFKKFVGQSPNSCRRQYEES